MNATLKTKIPKNAVVMCDQLIRHPNNPRRYGILIRYMSGIYAMLDLFGVVYSIRYSDAIQIIQDNM